MIVKKDEKNGGCVMFTYVKRSEEGKPAFRRQTDPT